MNNRAKSIQEIVMALECFWQEEHCLIHQPYDLPMGAGTLHPATFFGVLSEEPCRIAYAQPCRRPADSRDGRHPNRLQRYLQFQVLIKPAPETPEEQEHLYQLFYKSLDYVGLVTRGSAIRWYRDDWGSPMLGAKGEGWEVRCNGLEIAQYTYFQKMGGKACMPCVEITYGVERVALCVQDQDNIWDVRYGRENHETYGALFYHRLEKENAQYNTLGRDNEELEAHFNTLLSSKLTGFVTVDYERYCLEPSHLFNILDARGRITHIMRPTYIRKVRNNAKRIAEKILIPSSKPFWPLKVMCEPPENTLFHSEMMKLHVTTHNDDRLPLWLVKAMMCVDFPDILTENLLKKEDGWYCSLKVLEGKNTSYVKRGYCRAISARLDDALYFITMDRKNMHTYAKNLAQVSYITSDRLTLTRADQYTNRQILLKKLWDLWPKKSFTFSLLKEVILCSLATQQCKTVEEWPNCASFLGSLFLENESTKFSKLSSSQKQEITNLIEGKQGAVPDYLQSSFVLINSLEALAVIAIENRLKDGTSGARKKAFEVLNSGFFYKIRPWSLADEKRLFDLAVEGYAPKARNIRSKDIQSIGEMLYTFVRKRFENSLPESHVKISTGFSIAQCIQRKAFLDIGRK